MKITLNKGQRLWFTSDTHYNHSNICSATTKWNDPSTSREFKSLEHMNNTLVSNINEKVGQDDILFHLGDWSFGGFDKIQEFRDRIICKNIHLVLGNHDDHISNNKENIQTLFNSVNKYVDLVVTFNIGTSSRYDASFVLMHYPIASWNNMARGTIHLFGHVHSNPSVRLGPGKMMDVGMDGNNLYPISINEVLSIMSKQPIKSLFINDHHEIIENYKK